MSAVTLRAPGHAALLAAADPAGERRAGALVAGAFLAVFVAGASLFPLDAATHAAGTLVVEGQRQEVAHRDGGVVGAIRIREGQRVRQGQVLIELLSPETAAQVAALEAQVDQAIAERARLEAEVAGAGGIAPPPEFAARSGEARERGEAALAQQRRILAERRGVLAARMGGFGARVSQTGGQGRGLAAQQVATREQIRLLDEQLAAMAPLVDKGFVSRNRVRELQRARAALQGQLDQYATGVDQAADAAGELRAAMREGRGDFAARASAELSATLARLAEALPQLAAARARLAATQVRAPVDGEVVGLSVFTPGGVVAAGQPLLSIVPDRQPLRIAVQIAPGDAEGLRVGAPARVRLSGLRDRTLPEVSATLARISADTLADANTGQRYFTAELDPSPAEIARIGVADRLRAGMPAEVLIPRRKRTALQYLLEPLVGSFWGALHER